MEISSASIGIIGGADGPTAIFISSPAPNWLNWFGLFFMVLILIPNIIYALRVTNQANRCSSRILNILEQVGRYGCMVLMVIGAAFWKRGFPSAASILIYLIGNSLLILAYWICWIPFYLKRRKGLALALALLPACIFLLSGVTMRDPLLTILAVMFGIGHVSVTMRKD